MCLPLTEIRVIWLKRKGTRLIFRFPGYEPGVGRDWGGDDLNWGGDDLIYPNLEDGSAEGAMLMGARVFVCTHIRTLKESF